MYETSVAVDSIHLLQWSRSAEKHLLEPLVNTLNGRLNWKARADQHFSRPSRSRSTFICSTEAKNFRIMVYRNKRSRASSTGAHSVEPSFPDRLANALKSLKPALLTHGSGNSSNFRNNSKSAVVDADDVLYFSNVSERHCVKEPTTVDGCTKKTYNMDWSESEPSTKNQNLYAYRQHRPTQRKGYDNGQQMRNLKTLDDIRQLYKSVPNFGVLNESDSEKSNTYNARHTSSTLNQSNDVLVADLNSNLPSSDKSQPATNNVSPSLSPRSFQAMSLSISSSTSSTRSAADSGYRSHKRPMTQQTENLNEGLSRAKVDCSKSFSSSSDMRSIVYVNSSIDETTQSVPRNSNTHQPVVLHVSKTIIATGPTTNSQSTWVNLPIDCPGPCKSVFTYTTNDLRNVVATMMHLNGALNSACYSTILELFRSTLDRFCLELRRFVGPFVKCSRRDVNMALMTFLDEKTAYKCIDHASQAISTYSKNSTICMNMENRASLKLDVGKMLRFLRYSRVVKIAFDTIAVYMSAVFEKLLILYVQSVEKTRNQQAWNEVFQQHDSLFDVFTKFDSLPGICVKSRLALEGLLSVATSQLNDTWHQRWAHNYELGLRFDENAKQSMFHFVRCPGNDCNCKQKKPTFTDWMLKLMYMAEYRNTQILNAFDVLEVARCLGVVKELPSRPVEDLVDTVETADWKCLDVAYLWDESEAKMPDLRAQLSFCDPNRINAHALSCLSRCIICKNSTAAETILNQNCNIDVPITPSNIKGLQRNCKMFEEFLGWSPLFWAIATDNLELTCKLIQKRVKLNAGWMLSETPLQIAAAIDNEQILKTLLSEAVDLFFTSVRYNGETDDKLGTPSAISIAAMQGRTRVFELLLDECRSLGSTLKYQVPPSIADLLKNENMNTSSTTMESCTQTPNYCVFSKSAQCSLQEALYYSLECGNLDVAYDLSSFGVKWNTNMWTKLLCWAMEQKSGLGIKLFIDTLQIAQLTDSPIFLLEEFCSILFKAVELSLTQSFIDEDIRNGLLSSVALIFKQFYSASNERWPESVLPIAKPTNVDSQFCDNERYSDVQFVVEERKIFAHRIVISAHPKFEGALQSVNNIIQIDDVSYDVFKAIIEFVYGKYTECIQRISGLPTSEQLRAIDLAQKFGLDKLIASIVELIREQIACDSCIAVFVYACNTSNQQLLQIVEPFLLQNLQKLMSTHESNQRELIIDLNQKFGLFRRLTDYLNSCFRHSYESPQTLQMFSVQKF